MKTKFLEIAKIFFAYMCFVSVSAYGGQEIGNGGDVVVCPGKPPEMLDLFESKKIWKRRIIEPQIDWTWKEVAFFTADQVAIFDPVGSKNLKDSIENFETNVTLLEGLSFSDYSDQQHVAIPKECKLEQIAVQDPPQPNPYKKIVINKDLWDQMDNLNKASLVIHESLFSKAKENKQFSAAKVRFLNGYYFSTEWPSLTAKEVDEIYLKASFPVPFVQGPFDLKLHPSSVKRGNQGQILEGTIIPKWENGNSPLIQSQVCILQKCTTWTAVPLAGIIEFYSNGGIKSLIHGNFSNHSQGWIITSLQSVCPMKTFWNPDGLPEKTFSLCKSSPQIEISYPWSEIGGVGLLELESLTDDAQNFIQWSNVSGVPLSLLKIVNSPETNGVFFAPFFETCPLESSTDRNKQAQWFNAKKTIEFYPSGLVKDTFLSLGSKPIYGIFVEAKVTGNEIPESWNQESQIWISGAEVRLNDLNCTMNKPQ